MFSTAIACARISSAPGHAIVSFELLLALIALLVTTGVFLRHQRELPIPRPRTLYGLAGLYVALAVAVPVGILAARGHGVLVGDVCAPAGLITVAIAIALCVAVPLLLAQVFTTAARAEMAGRQDGPMQPQPRRVIPMTAPMPAQRTARAEARAEATSVDDWLQARRVIPLRAREATQGAPSGRRGV